MKNSGKKVYKAVALVTVFGIAARGVGFLFKVYVGRKLGAEAVGLYQLSLSVLFLLSAVASSGIPLVLSRRIAAASDDGEVFGYVGSGLLICCGVSAILVLLFYLLGDNLAVFFSDLRAVPVFMIVLPSLLSTSVYAAVRAYFLGKKRFFAFSVTELAEEVVKVAICIVLCNGKLNVSGAKAIAVAFVASDFVCAAVLTAIFFAEGGRLKRPTALKNIVKSSFPLTLIRIFGSLIGSLTAFIVPLLLVRSGMTSAEATADYGRVTGMSMPLLMAPLSVTGALSTVLIPEVASSKKSGLAAKINSSTLFAAIIGSIFVMIYIPLGESLGTFLFNDARAGRYVSIAAVMIFPLELNQITTGILNSLGREKTTFLHFIAGSAATLACLLVLPSKIGVYAIAGGSFCCFAITSVLNYRVLIKTEGLPLDFKKPLRALLLALPSGILCYAIKGISEWYLPLGGSVILSAGVSAVWYIASLWLANVLDFASFRSKKGNPQRIAETVARVK